MALALLILPQASPLPTTAAWLPGMPSAAPTTPPPPPSLWRAAVCPTPLACAAHPSASTPPAQPPWWACTWPPRDWPAARHACLTHLVSELGACWQGREASERGARRATAAHHLQDCMHAACCMHKHIARCPAPHLMCPFPSLCFPTCHWCAPCRRAHPSHVNLNLLRLGCQHAVTQRPLPCAGRRCGCTGLAGLV